MKRPERDQYAEPEQQEREDEMLRRQRKRSVSQRRYLGQRGNIERVGAGLHVKRDQADEREQRAEAEIERDLERGVILRSPRPQTPIMMKVGTSASSWKK